MREITDISQIKVGDKVRASSTFEHPAEQHQGTIGEVFDIMDVDNGYCLSVRWGNSHENQYRLNNVLLVEDIVDNYETF